MNVRLGLSSLPHTHRWSIYFKTRLTAGIDLAAAIQLLPAFPTKLSGPLHVVIPSVNRRFCVNPSWMPAKDTVFAGSPACR